MGKNNNNRGSATIEVCFVMPIILFIISIIIGLFINLVATSRLWSKGYVMLYTYSFHDCEEETAEQAFREALATREDEEVIAFDIDGGKLKMSTERDNGTTNSSYMYSKEEFQYGREIDLLTSRLRRWQLYGDILQE